MRVSKTNISPTNVTLNVTADAVDLAPIKRHVLAHFTYQVRVPGFRAGKAPLDMIEKHVDQQRLANEFMEHALNELFRRAMEQEKLRPVGQPNVSVKKFVPYELLEFEASFDVLGPIVLPNYKAIKQAKKKVEVTAKEVSDVLANLRLRAAERTEVDRAAKEGDEVVADFSGQDQKGQPVAGADGKDYPIILGNSSFIPGFEENLVGMKPGDSSEFTIPFPKDYGVAALQGKKVKFKVHAKKVNELKQLKLDDEFATKVGPFKTLDELKADIKKQLLSEKQLQVDREYENELVRKIAEKTKIDVPASMVEEQLRVMEEQEKQNLAYRGITWQEHLEQEGLTEKQHRDRHRPDAEVRIKGGLVLGEIADKEKIAVAQEEVDLRLQMLKGQHQDPAMQAELDKPEARSDIAGRLLTEKTLQKLVDSAGK